MTEDTGPFVLSCSLPRTDADRVLLAHGGGGRLMRELIESLIAPGLAGPELATDQDGAVFEAAGARLAFTTDSHVVAPLFFPGGDIGTLAVNGTVNDLAMCGARPLCLSCAFILEEGLPLETLRLVVASMREAAQRAEVRVVTGDTKVVDRGKGDGIFVNTAGVGVVAHDLVLAPASVSAGDRILLNGDIGRHGMAVMSRRENLTFESTIESDCAPLARPVLALLEAGVRVHCLRDLTRGGLAAGLTEIARAASLRVVAEEAAIPVRQDVRDACEFFGLDPMHVANEGRFIACIDPEDEMRALSVLRSFGGVEAIGTVTGRHPGGLVTVRTAYGAERILDLPAGEPLPRIC